MSLLAVLTVKVSAILLLALVGTLCLRGELGLREALGAGGRGRRSGSCAGTRRSADSTGGANGSNRTVRVRRAPAGFPRPVHRTGSRCRRGGNGGCIASDPRRRSSPAATSSAGWP